MRTIVKILARLLSLALAGALAGGCLLAALGYKMYRQALDARSLEATIAAVQADPGYTPIGQLPPLYLDAVVAVEDHRFAQHSGIDPIAILRAAVHDLRTRSLDQGGSTITQQVAKNLFFTQEKRFTRKIAEVFMAFRLEDAYTKDEILELYVLLAGIPNAPSVYSLTANPDLAAQRQQYVVGQMVKFGYLTAEDAAAITPPAA